jgi:uncharacterized protein YdeI (YjbR/CyaY-like superfamily)
MIVKGGRQQYVTWIEDAKKPETRARRIQKAIERIEASKKPSG